MDIEIDMDISEPLYVFDEMLNWRQRRNVLTAAKRAGGNVVRKEAAKLAPKGSYPPHQVAAGRVPGRLKRSLNRAKTGLTITQRNKNVYVVAGLSDEDPFYARFVEKGHTIRKIRRGPILGEVSGKRFMQRAAIATETETFNAFQKKFIETTYKQLEKARRRAVGRRRRT